MGGEVVALTNNAIGELEKVPQKLEDLVVPFWIMVGAIAAGSFLCIVAGVFIEPFFLLGAFVLTPFLLSWVQNLRWIQDRLRVRKSFADVKTLLEQVQEMGDVSNGNISDTN